MENVFLEDLKSFMDQSEIKELDISLDNTFIVTNKKQADFVIRKIIEARTDKEVIKNSAAEEKDRLNKTIDDWEEKEINSIDATISHFEGLLRNFAELELAGSEKKSLKLPFGTLSFKKQQDKYTYDEDVLMDYLKKNAPSFISEKKTYSPDKKSIKENGEVKEGKVVLDGKIVSGITVDSLPDKFEVKG